SALALKGADWAISRNGSDCLTVIPQVHQVASDIGETSLQPRIVNMAPPIARRSLAIVGMHVLLPPRSAREALEAVSPQHLVEPRRGHADVAMGQQALDFGALLWPDQVLVAQQQHVWIPRRCIDPGTLGGEQAVI